jgi:hypothetical protein
MYILVYIKKFMSMKPNPKEINTILNILKGAQFECLPRAPFYIDTPLASANLLTGNGQRTNPVLDNCRQFRLSIAVRTQNFVGEATPKAKQPEP